MQTNVSVAADPAAEATMKKEYTYHRRPAEVLCKTSWRGSPGIPYTAGSGDHFCTAVLSDRLCACKRYPLSERKSVQFHLYLRERLPSPVTDQYPDHDTGISGDCRSGRNFCSDLPCGILQKKAAAL